MRWIGFAVLCAVFILSGTAHARDDEPAALPEAVATAWEAYQEASRAGDINAAGDAALAAHRAAQAGGVDPLTRAILADTAGQFAFIRNDYAGAIELLQAAVALYAPMGDAQIDGHVQALSLLANAYHLHEQNREALRWADRAISVAGTPGADPQRDVDIALAMSVRARTHWRQGSIGRAGRAAQEALDVLEPYGLENHSGASLMAFYVGVERALRQRMNESAWWFAVADHLFRVQDQDRNLMQITDVWSRYARERMPSAQRRDLIQRLDAAGYLTAPEREEAEAELDAAEEQERAEPDPLNRPARPLRREAPSYPPTAAQAGLEGIALLTFTVNAQGRVEDAVVVFSAPHPMFGQEAMRTIRRWRYEPRLVDGVPTAHEGVRTTFDFRMED